MGDLADEPLGRLLTVALSAVLEDLNDRLARAGWPGVRPLWGFVLLSIRDEPHSIGELGDLLGVSKQAAAKVVASLMDAGLVLREEHPTDRRTALIRLSDNGVRFHKDAETAYRAIEETWTDAVGQHRMTTFRGVLAEGIRMRYGADLPPLRPAL
jgi:DNA-binding MarR family transcriptional regulator